MVSYYYFSEVIPQSVVYFMLRRSRKGFIQYHSYYWSFLAPCKLESHISMPYHIISNQIIYYHIISYTIISMVHSRFDVDIIIISTWSSASNHSPEQDLQTATDLSESTPTVANLLPSLENDRQAMPCRWWCGSERSLR